MKFGVPAAALGIIGYGIYDAIKNKNVTSQKVEMGDKKEYPKAALAGAAIQGVTDLVAKYSSK